MINRIHIIFCLVICFAFSCKKDKLENDSLQIGYEYYPLDTNNYVVYTVTEIDLDVKVGKYDTVKYQLKERLADTIFNEGKDVVSFKMERYIRLDSTREWEIKNVWQVKQSNRNLIRIEDNIPLVKQVYPMVKNQIWNVHRYDTLPEQTATLVDYNFPEKIGKFSFDSIAQVVITDYETLVEKQYETEKYAKNIGLVFKQNIDVESQTIGNNTIDLSKPIMQRITKGKIIIWEISDHN